MELRTYVHKPTDIVHSNTSYEGYRGLLDCEIQHVIYAADTLVETPGRVITCLVCLWRRATS